MEGYITETWNFRGYVSTYLEYYLKECGLNENYTIADIHCGAFAEVMIRLLRHKKIETIEAKEFIQKCERYIGKTALEIGNETAKELFDEFHKIWIQETK